jgi:peptidoglycan/xylan/chitin deacetylase (PgdA/CDA1 family)
MKCLSATLLTFLIIIMVGAIISASSCYMAKAEVPHGIISIAFDDNYQNQYDYARPLLQNYSIVGTFYVVTDHVGLPGYMNYSQLQTLQSNGNDIGSHSKTHTTLTSLSETQIRQECNLSKQALENHGLTVTDFSFPNGHTNDFVDSIVSQYYRSGRTAYIEPYLMNIPTTQFRVAGFSAELPQIPPGSALSSLENMVDQVYQTNGWAIIFFHNILPLNGTYQDYTTTTQDFESFLNYTVNKGVQTLTVNQALDLTSLLITSNFGTVTPTNGTYNISDTVNIQAFAPSVGDGERYVWLGWNGSGAGSYTGMDNPASITMNGAITETAQWRHEYQITFNQNGLDSSANETVVAIDSAPQGFSDLPFSKWVTSGSSLNFSYAGTISSATTGTQFVLTGVNASSPLDVASPTTVTSNYKTQYYLTVASAHGTFGGSGWYDIDSTAHASLTDGTMAGGTGTQYVFTSWSTDASGTNYAESEGIIMSGSKMATANWKTQYLLSFVASPSGAGTTTPSGTNLWKDNGILSISATPNSGYTLSSWSSSTGSITFANANLDSTTATISGPGTIIANFANAFTITFTENGLAAGTHWSVTFNGATRSSTTNTITYTGITSGTHLWNVSTPTSGATGTRYIARTSSGTMNVPTQTSQTLAYTTQYYLNVTSAYGTAIGSGWYNSGSTAYATVTPLVVTVSSNGVNDSDSFEVSVKSLTDTNHQDHRWVCTGFSLDNETYQSGTQITLNHVTAPHSVTFVWKEQFFVVFEKTGLPDDIMINVTVNSANYILPYSGWFDKGANVTFTYESHLPSGFGAEYILISSSAESPIKIDAATEILAQYSYQFTAVIYLFILIPIIIAVVVAALLLIRRRGKKQNE